MVHKLIRNPILIGKLPNPTKTEMIIRYPVDETLAGTQSVSNHLNTGSRGLQLGAGHDFVRWQCAFVSQSSQQRVMVFALIVRKEKELVDQSLSHPLPLRKE